MTAKRPPREKGRGVGIKAFKYGWNKIPIIQTYRPIKNQPLVKMGGDCPSLPGYKGGTNLSLKGNETHVEGELISTNILCGGEERQGQNKLANGEMRQQTGNSEPL